MPCRSACEAPGTHETLGACIRASGIRIGAVDATQQRLWDSEIESYRAARAQGIQPAGTRMHQIRQALDYSDASGVAYDAGKGF